MNFGLRNLGLALMGVTLVSAGAAANTISFSTPGDATASSGRTVDAMAVLTTGSDTLTITLTNGLTAAQSIDVSQDISDLMFSFIGQTGAASLSSSFGDSETVNNNTDGSIDDGLISPTGWGLIGTSGNLELCVIGPSGCGIADQASQTIIGGSAGDVYASANGSIIGSGHGGGNNGHTPFLVGPVTFVIDIPGLTSLSTISGVSFSFGTTAGDDITGVCTPGSASCVTTTAVTPEPASLLLLGTGLGALGIRLRKRATKAA